LPLFVRIAPLLLGAALLAPLAATAQAPRRHYDGQARAFYRGPARLTAGGGAALYVGDLGGLRPGPALNVGTIYTWRPHWAVGGELTWFQLAGTDKVLTRNISFRGRNLSLAAFVRYEPLSDPAWYSATRNQNARVKPFVQAGGGFALYNPKAYTGTNIPGNDAGFLPPERPDYPGTALIAPVGGGLSFYVVPRLWITGQGTYVFTSTDHLDDVSQRANPAQNDGYGLIEVKVEYQLK
jgi:Outer membrane protein beta-barrel domain